MATNHFTISKCSITINAGTENASSNNSEKSKKPYDRSNNKNKPNNYDQKSFKSLHKRRNEDGDWGTRGIRVISIDRRP